MTLAGHAAAEGRGEARTLWREHARLLHTSPWKAKEKAEQERIEALRTYYPTSFGGRRVRVPRSQPGPEIVTFGRIPGSKGIRRVEP